jgi:hypothetical protein
VIVLLAQSRCWKATFTKATSIVTIAVQRESVSEEQKELRELRIEIPLEKWNRVVKNVRSDRKLLGGILLDYAKHKDQVGVAVSNDRLFFELQRTLVDSTVSLVEAGTLSLGVLDVGGS